MSLPICKAFLDDSSGVDNFLFAADFFWRNFLVRLPVFELTTGDFLGRPLLGDLETTVFPFDFSGLSSSSDCLNDCLTVTGDSLFFGQPLREDGFSGDRAFFSPAFVGVGISPFFGI